jgi:hypothetical protein
MPESSEVEPMISAGPRLPLPFPEGYDSDTLPASVQAWLERDNSIRIRQGNPIRSLEKAFDQSGSW